MTAPTFHAGERAVQERVGVAARMAEFGPRVIRDFMPDQHREFFAQLPFVIAGTKDAAGQPWAAGPQSRRCDWIMQELGWTATGSL